MAMIGHQLRGYARLGATPLLRRLTAENLLIWILASVILCGTLFVSLQLAAHGAWLVEDIAEVASRKLPITSAYLAALVIVILPVLVPAAWVALPLYWAILLLPYARPSERAVVGVVALVLVASPMLLSAQARRVAVELEVPMEAARSLEEHRLYGGLINDVGALRAEFGSLPAVIHLVADMHQDLGEIEYARVLYQRLIDLEPLNVSALNNIGAYYMRRRETSQAIDHLERAAAIDERRLEPYRNLWVLYRDYLAFEEAEQVLARVRAVAPGRVATWFTEGPSAIAVMRDGYDRAPEIRAALRAKASSRPLDSAPRPSRLRFFSVGVFLAIAAALAVALGRFGVGRRRGPRRRIDPPGRALAWVPGLRSIHAGRGWRAFFALLIPVGTILLARLSTLGYRLPWGSNPNPSVTWVLCVVLVLLYLGARWWAARLRSDDVD
jgi:tetratricopeptide (TPR) repeat protein